MYALYRGPATTTPRAIVLRHTVRGVPVAVVMLGVKRATERHYRQVGQRALDTLTIMGVNVGSTDPLVFGQRFAHPVDQLELHPLFCLNQDTNTGTASVSYTHSHGGGDYPATTDVLDNQGMPVVLAPIDYSAPIN